MIIHVAGGSGSGKSYLGKRLKENKNLIVVDTDDIADQNSRKLKETSKKYNKLVETQDDERFFMVDKLNMKDIKKLINEAKTTKKNLVIVGIAFGGGEADPNKYADVKLFIKIDPETHYKRLALRTIDDFYKNHDKMVDLFKSDKSPNSINEYIFDTLGMKRTMIESYDDFLKSEKKFQKGFKKNNYKFLTNDEIFELIDSLSLYDIKLTFTTYKDTQFPYIKIVINCNTNIKWFQIVNVNSEYYKPINDPLFNKFQDRFLDNNTFIDSTLDDKMFPFYSYGREFVDFPIYGYNENTKLKWIAKVYAVTDTKNMYYIYGLEWGFEIINGKVNLIHPKKLNNDHIFIKYITIIKNINDK